MAESIRIEISGVDQFSPAFAALNTALNNVQQPVKSAESAFTKLGAQIVVANQAFHLMTGAMQTARAVYNQTIGAVLEVSAKFELLDVMLKRVEGDVYAAADAKTRLLGVINDIPISLDNVTSGYVKLKTLGFEDSERIIRALGDAVSAFGGSAQNFDRAMVAITQMAGKGVISMEELRQQLGEQVPGAIQILARELGLTLPELFEKTQKGALSAKEGIDALTRGLEKDFGGAGAQMMDTFTGKVAKLTNAWEQLLVALGNTGVFAVAKAAIELLTMSIQGWADIITRIVDLWTTTHETMRKAAALQRDLAKGTVDYSDAVTRLQESHSTATETLKLYIKDQEIETRLQKEAADAAAESAHRTRQYYASLDTLIKGLDEAEEALRLYRDRNREVADGAYDVVEPTETLAEAIGRLAEKLGMLKAVLPPVNEALERQGAIIRELSRAVDEMAGQKGGLFGKSPSERGLFTPEIGALNELNALLPTLLEDLMAAGVEITKFNVDALNMMKDALNALDEPLPLLLGDLENVEVRIVNLNDAMGFFADTITTTATPAIEDIAGPIWGLIEKTQSWAEANMEVSRSYGLLGKDIDTFTDELNDLASAFDAAAGQPGGFAGRPRNQFERDIGQGAGYPGAQDYYRGLGQSWAGQFAGMGGAMQGFGAGGPMGAIAGFFSELLMRNEKMQEVIGKVNDALVTMMDPIAEAIAPALEAIVPLVQELAPEFKLIGKLLALWIATQRPLIRALTQLIAAINRIASGGGALSDFIGVGGALGGAGGAITGGGVGTFFGVGMRELQVGGGRLTPRGVTIQVMHPDTHQVTEMVARKMREMMFTGRFGTV